MSEQRPWTRWLVTTAVVAGIALGALLAWIAFGH